MSSSAQTGTTSQEAVSSNTSTDASKRAVRKTSAKRKTTSRKSSTTTRSTKTSTSSVRTQQSAKLPENAVIHYKPHPGPQTIFHQRTEFEVLYGGAKGGGKSLALLAEATRQVANPNYKAIIFRRSFPELQELIDRSHQMYAAIPGAKWKAADHRWEFQSGATIRMAFMDADSDKYKYQGHEYQFMGFDEATHFLWSQYSYMLGMCRTSDPSLRCYVRLATNPGGPGHGWVKQRFIDNTPPYETFTDPETGLTRAFIPAKVYDNPSLLEADPLYIARLKSMSPDEVRALLEGDWNTYQGQVFKEFDPSIHVSEPFYIPESWPRYRSFDWGYSRPFSVGWWAVDENGCAWRYREWYGMKEGRPNEGITLSAYDVGKGIAEREADEISKGLDIVGFADPACWSNNGSQSVMEQMLEGYKAQSGNECVFTKADNNRLNGLQQVHVRLQRQMLKVFSTCFHFIRTIPALPYDSIKVEDVDTDAEDHCYDDVRYFCQARPLNADAPIPDTPKTYDQKVWDHYADIVRHKEEYNDDVLGSDW